jgi:osmotically-inducible protein OsmY
MKEPTNAVSRPDVDIEADIEHLIAHYPPLVKDRHSFKTLVQNGVVTVSGHVQTPITRSYLLKNLPLVPGVTDVKSDYLYSDETIRLEASRLIPVGVVLGRVQYGSVVLTGTLPDGTTADALVSQIRNVPGVKQVFTDFEAT